ncbi:hypothetical protein KR222_000951, partial [Zaprionus bogoriensis]
ISAESAKSGKLSCFFASGFILFWGLLFFAVVIPFFYRLPTARTTEDADSNVFIAERAYKDLYTLSNIGTKMVGSAENEIEAVQFLVKVLSQIKEDSLKDYFDIEIDVSQVSGQFISSNRNVMYQGVQNIAAKITPANCTSESYLLVNSHFDSKPATPSAGDDGFMVATMLEVLRVMSKTKQSFAHPIVFLFNGAEETNLLAAHGFINNHKWAPNLKAVVNLEGAGSGGREVLFQTGPNHSWLVNYYNKYAKHPFGTTLAEEIFQSGVLPSDTDFSVFKKFMPGLDIAQVINGFIYHTEYDVIDHISHECFQNTGDNVLSLIRGLANATELYNTEAHQSGHAVYFDFLGLVFIHYSETSGKVLNFGVAAATAALVLLSLCRMSSVSGNSLCTVICWFFLVQIVQLVSFILALVLPIAIEYVMDSFGHSLTYYSTPLLVIGLYVCPSLIGLSLPTIIYYSGHHKVSTISISKGKHLTKFLFITLQERFSPAYHLQLALHGQAIILAVLVSTCTALGIRSTYILVIPLIFYVASLALNLMTSLHDRGYSWTGLLKLGQVIPFLYSSYIIYLFVVVLTPMGARAGSASNRDIYITALAAVGTILSFGFLTPLINTFRRPSLVVYSLITITAFSIFLATSTQLGFPYRAKTSGQRVAYLHARNVFYEYDGSLSNDESGYLFLYQDRRKEASLSGSKVNLTGLVSIVPECEKHMMCGLPLYDSRYVAQRLESKWLPRSEPIVMPGDVTLEMLGRSVVNATTVRFVFNLTGPAQMSLFFQAYEDAEITDWSFLREYLENPPAYPLSYHIYFNYGIVSSSLVFFVEVSKTNGNFNVPLFQLGVSGHFIGDSGDEQSKQFASTFPSFAILADWPALYKRYIF